MNIEQEHAELVKRLVKPPKEIYESMTTHTLAILHAVMGIVGEAMEIEQALDNWDIPNFKEEVGDIEFYIKDFRICFGEDEERQGEVFLFTMEGTVSLMKCNVRKLHDKCKKYIVYNEASKDVITSMRDSVNVIQSCVATFCKLLMINREECLRENIDKLNKRYPKGYTDEHAAQRLDKV